MSLCDRVREFVHDYITHPEEDWAKANILYKKILVDPLAAAGILITAPVIGIAYIGIALTSEGNPVFKREIDCDGKQINFYKLRTMYDGAQNHLDEAIRLGYYTPAGPKSGKDPRITPFGRFLRKTSIDELPQLFNVLKGHLHVIGKRPIPKYDRDALDEEDAEFMCQPPFGIFDNATLNARNGYMKEGIPYSRQYQEKFESQLIIFEDYKIILKGIKHVLEFRHTC